MKESMQASNNKKYKYLILILLALTLIIIIRFVYVEKEEKMFLESSSFCKLDSECMLYDCTNCGNMEWIKENDASTEDCKNNVPGLVGCYCSNNVCKRKYEN